MAERKTKLPLKPCVTCGEMFQPKRTDHACCGKRCRGKYYRERQRVYMAEYKKKKKEENKVKKTEKPKTNHEKIADIAIAARKEGLTYGQYVAKYMGRF